LTAFESSDFVKTTFGVEIAERDAVAARGQWNATVGLHRLGVDEGLRGGLGDATYADQGSVHDIADAVDAAAGSAQSAPTDIGRLRRVVKAE
jgi:hypothetical protein